MRKKNNLALFTLLFVGLFSLITSNIFAQDKVSTKSTQQTKLNKENDVLQNYITISSLPSNNRKKAFSELSANDKSNIFRLHLAMQFVKRPNLTIDQKEIILESISKIDLDSYDKTKNRTNTEISAQDIEVRASSLFTKQDLLNIFANLGGTSQDVEMLRKYSDIISLSSFPERKMAFSKASATEMSNLWKIQLAYYISKDNELTNTQKDFIIRTIEFANPSLFAKLKNANENTQINENIAVFESEALTLFPEQKAFTIFNRLGFSGSCELPKGANSNLMPAGTDCTCRNYGGDCSSSTVCAGGGCEGTWFGCGFLYLQSCSGECRR